MTAANLLLTGAVALASAVAGLFFLRFWRQTRDRFFLYFALAFWLEGISRLVAGLPGTGEDSPLIYLVRLLAYGLILLAIWQRNRPPR